MQYIFYVDQLGTFSRACLSPDDLCSLLSLPSSGATEEDRLSALVGEHRFPRSSSMTDSLRDHSQPHPIPPPPQTAPPPPPYYLDTGPPPAFCPPPPPSRTQSQGHEPAGRSSFKPSSLDLPYEAAQRQATHIERQKKARSMIILQDSSHLPVEPTEIPRPSAATPPERIKRKGRVIDNPYANVGQFSIGLYTPTKPQRKKSPLVKQLQVGGTLSMLSDFFCFNLNVKKKKEPDFFWSLHCRWKMHKKKLVWP